MAALAQAKHIYHTLSKVADACASISKSMQHIPSDLFKLTIVKHHLALEVKAEDKEYPNPPAANEALKGACGVIEEGKSTERLQGIYGVREGRGFIDVYFGNICVPPTTDTLLDKQDAGKLVKGGTGVDFRKFHRKGVMSPTISPICLE
jgi:hypothetical protein